MAVSQDHPGLSVVIMVDGKPLREYPSNDIDDPKNLKLLRGINNSLDPTIDEAIGRIKYMVRYIEATSSKRFTFRLDKQAGFPRDCHHLGVKWEVNDFETNIRHEPIDVSNPDAHWTAECRRVGTGTAGKDLFWQYFSFRDLKTIENDEFTKADIAELTKEARELGVLRVLVYQMQESTCSSTQTQFNSPWSRDKFPEKALRGRALSHTVRYEEEIITTGPPVLQADVFQHPQKLPFIVFEFRYRSREGLVQERIIPQTVPNGFKESRRRDGKVVLNLDSDEESDAAGNSATVLRGPEVGMNQDNMVVDLDSDDADDSLFVHQSPDRRMRCETVEDEDDSLFIHQSSYRRMRRERVDDQDNDLSHSHSASKPAGKKEKSTSTGGNHSATRSFVNNTLDPESNNNRRSPDRRARCETADEDSPVEVLQFKPHKKINANKDKFLDESGSDSDVTLQ